MEKVYTNLTTGGPISVYVEDGKITRIRPLQVPKEDYPKAWTVVDRNGKKYSPPKAMRISQNILAERNRLYSEDRILYPMKRVDWDPNGNRNPQNRGKSDYVRISWDEAAEIIASEIKRLIKVNPDGTVDGHKITAITSSHHNWGIVGYKMAPFRAVLRHAGLYASWTTRTPGKAGCGARRTCTASTGASVSRSSSTSCRTR